MGYWNNGKLYPSGVKSKLGHPSALEAGPGFFSIEDHLKIN
jgi:hypothetical protein